MDFISNFSPIELLLVLGGVGYLVWNFFLRGKTTTGGTAVVTTTSTPSVSDKVGQVLASLTNKVVETTKKDTSLVALAASWENLHNELEAAGNTEALEQLDELWVLLNHKTSKKV